MRSWSTGPRSGWCFAPGAPGCYKPPRPFPHRVLLYSPPEWGRRSGRTEGRDGGGVGVVDGTWDWAFEKS